MNDPKRNPSLLLRPDYVVCTCLGVMYTEIIAAMQAGDRTFAELSDRLLVGTGCSSCVEEIQGILAEYTQQKVEISNK